MASKALIEEEPTPAPARTAPDRAAGDGSELPGGRAPLWSLLRAREEQEKALPAAAEDAAERGESGAEEASDDDTSHSSEVRERFETAELSRSGVLQARAAAVLDGSAAEHVKRRDVRIGPAKLEGERSLRPAHASATSAYHRDQKHELSTPRPLAQAVGRTCARWSSCFHCRRCALRLPDP